MHMQQVSYHNKLPAKGGLWGTPIMKGSYGLTNAPQLRPCNYSVQKDLKVTLYMYMYLIANKVRLTPTDVLVEP